MTTATTPAPATATPSKPNRFARLMRGWTVPLDRRPTGAVIVFQASLILVVFVGWFLLFAFGLSGVNEARSQQSLYAQMRQNLALATAPLGGDIPFGTPVAIMNIPSLHIQNLVVVSGTRSGDTMAGPGLERATPLPGQVGTSVVLGRSAMFGGPFAHISSLLTGATIDVTTQQGSFTFHVLDVRRPGDRLPQPLAANASRLVLVTGGGSGWRSTWAPQYAIFVDADMVGKAQPGVGTVAIGSNEAIFAGDPAALIPLIFLLQALLICSVGLVWARYRWGLIQTWIVGFPVLAWVMWETSIQIIRLLPNIL